MLEIPVELGPRRYTVSVGHGLSRLLPDLLAAARGKGGGSPEQLQIAAADAAGAEAAFALARDRLTSG